MQNSLKAKKVQLYGYFMYASVVSYGCRNLVWVYEASVNIATYY